MYWGWFWFVIFCIMFLYLLDANSGQENQKNHLKLIKYILEDEKNTPEGKISALRQILNLALKK